MKKWFALSLILLLLGLAASSQQIRDRLSNIPVSLRSRDIRLTVQQQYHLEQFRQQIARQRIRRDGIITPLEKKRLKKIKRHQRQRQIIKRQRRILS